MIVGNIVKEVLAYKKGQIQQKLSSPQAFVSSRFQEKLQSEPAEGDERYYAAGKGRGYESAGTIYENRNGRK